MTYQLFIGSNNKTHQLELEKINKILSKYHAGYTLFKAKGCWQGKSEQTAVVYITCEYTQAVTTAKLLRQALNQEAIGLIEAPEMRFI